jgi:hypothetical protein
MFGPPINRVVPAGSQPGDAAPPVNSVSRGVDVGYRVIEEYMRQGQTIAKSLWPAAASGSPNPPDPQRMMERMFEYASDLASLWLEYAQVTMGQLPNAPPVKPPVRPSDAPHVGGFDIGPNRQTASGRDRGVAQPSAARASPEAPSVSVDIVSKTRAEVSVELKPGAAKGELSVHDLRAGDARLPHITGVVVEGRPNENRVVVRLTLPDDHPVGVYSGLIVDHQSNLPMGMLSVRVLGPATS